MLLLEMATRTLILTADAHKTRVAPEEDFSLASLGRAFFTRVPFYRGKAVFHRKNLTSGLWEVEVFPGTDGPVTNAGYDAAQAGYKDFQLYYGGADFVIGDDSDSDISALAAVYEAAGYTVDGGVE